MEVTLNIIMFIIFLYINIILCIKRVPVLGGSVGFFTIILTGAVFMNDLNINVFFSYFLIIIGFVTLLLNGMDAGKKK